MKKLTLLTTAVIIAACGSANAANDPSLGDRLRQNWDSNVDRNMWNDPVKHEPAFPGVAPAEEPRQDGGMKHHGKMHGKHHEHHAAAAKTEAKKGEHKAKADGKTSEEKAKTRAERKAKWDAMTPEQKAAWKAKHAKKAAVTTSTPAAK